MDFYVDIIYYIYLDVILLSSPGGRGGQEGRIGRGQTEGRGYQDLPPPGGRGPREEDRLPSVQQIPDGRAPSPDVLPGGRDLFIQQLRPSWWRVRVTIRIFRITLSIY